MNKAKARAKSRRHTKEVIAKAKKLNMKPSDYVYMEKGIAWFRNLMLRSLKK